MKLVYFCIILSLLPFCTGIRAQQPEKETPPHAWFIKSEAHQGAVLSVALSPDEKTIASLGIDQQVKLWNSQTDQLLWQQKVNNSKILSNVAFSPDGKELAIGENDGQAAFLDVRSGKLKSRRAYHQKTIQHLAFSPDGKTLATASHDNTIKLWDISTGKERSKLNYTSWHFSFSADSNTLAVPGNRGIQLWNLTTMKEERRFYQPGLQHTPAFFCHNDTWVAGEVNNGKGLCLWNIAANKLSETIFGWFTADSPLAVSPDGTAILTSSSDIFGNEGFAIWNVATGQLSMRYEGLKYTLTNGHASLGKKGVVIGNRDGTVAHYERTSAMPIAEARRLRSTAVQPGDQAVERLALSQVDWGLGRSAFSQDGKKLYLSGKDAVIPRGANFSNNQQGMGFVRVWDVAAKKELAVFPPVGTHRFGNYHGPILPPVDAFGVSPDDKLLAIATNQEISLWDMETQKQLGSIVAHYKNGQGNRVNEKKISGLNLPLYAGSLRFTPDGKQLAMSGVGGTWIWDVAAQKVVMQSPEGGHLTFFTGHKYYATPMMHNRMKLWETTTGKELAQDHPVLGILREGGISEDNHWLVAGGEGGGMVWKLNDAATQPSLEQHLPLRTHGPVYGLGLSRDGKRALTVGGMPQLWDVQSGGIVAELKGLRRAAHGCLSGDGKCAAILAGDGVYLWRP